MDSNPSIEFEQERDECGGSVELLLAPQRLDLDSALALARSLAREEPLLDVLLIRKMFAGCHGDVRALEPAAALRVLALVEAISDGSRIASCLAPLLRHSSEQVRSKLALVLGRHTPKSEPREEFPGE